MHDFFAAHVPGPRFARSKDFRVFGDGAQARLLGTGSPQENASSKTTSSRPAKRRVIEADAMYGMRSTSERSKW
jgi:hypothetical protein